MPGPRRKLVWVSWTVYAGAALAGAATVVFLLVNRSPSARGRARAMGEAAELRFDQSACNLGSATGCNNLAFSYDLGRGVPKDSARAIPLYERACNAGNMSACNNLGVSYDDGDGVSRDPARAAIYYQKACNGGHAGACTNLGVAYRDGAGVPVDGPRAASLFATACERGDDDGCAAKDALKHAPGSGSGPVAP